MNHLFLRAEDGAQTRDPQLGRLMLERQQIYSLPHLATLVFAHSLLRFYLNSLIE